MEEELIKFVTDIVDHYLYFFNKKTDKFYYSKEDREDLIYRTIELVFTKYIKTYNSNWEEKKKCITGTIVKSLIIGKLYKDNKLESTK
jgi:hypothetical protein